MPSDLDPSFYYVRVGDEWVPKTTVTDGGRSEGDT